MPDQSDAQLIGDSGELWFQTQLPARWLFQRPTRDVGIDAVIVICEPGPLNGREFRVQIKASKQWTVRDGHIMVPGIKRSTIDYWFVSPLPTMLVAYDAERKLGYYRWHNEFLPDITHRWRSETAATLSLPVPMENRLDAEAWDGIRRSIQAHFINLRSALHDARDARSVLPVIHALAGAVRQLRAIDHQPIPAAERNPQQEGLLALVELLQHRTSSTRCLGCMGSLLRHRKVRSG